MASNDFRMMYKGKLKEGTSTTENRRKSKGLERKKCRDDEVNRRRLLSNMSPVSEDMLDDHEEKNGAQGKALSRIERLKQWKEERKKKQEESKKNSRKPMFKVSHLQHKDDLQIYNKEVPKAEDKKAVKLPVKSSDPGFKPIAKPGLTHNVVQKEVKKVEPKGPITDRKTRSVLKVASKVEDKEDVNVERKTRTGVNRAKPDVQAAMSVEKKARPVAKNVKLVEDVANVERKTRSAVRTNQGEEKGSKVAIEKKEKDQPELKRNQSRAQQKTSTALYCKPTAAAAAKANNEKHTNFLRAKPKQVAVTKAKPSTKAAQEKVIETEEEVAPEPQNVTPDRKKSVRLNTRPISIDSESEKDLHLSDSNVSTPKHSTPRPARSLDRVKSSGSKKIYKKTPAIKRVQSSLRAKEKKSARDISPIENVRTKKQYEEESSESESAEKDASGSDEESSPEKKSLNISNVSDKENIKVASPRLMRSAAKKSTVEEDSGENKAVQDVEMVAKKYTPKPKLSNLETSFTPKSGKTRGSWAQQDLNAKSSPAKRPRSLLMSSSSDQESESSLERSSKRTRFTNLKSPKSDEDTLNIITHEAQEPDPDLPMDEVNSAFKTRKSLRLAASVSDNDIANNPEKKPKTPKGRKSLLASKRKSRSKQRSRSVMVSVSDEGTSGSLGDNIIGEIHPTPEQHHKVEIACLNSSATCTPKARAKKSELIDVSDEGTSLMSEHNPTVVYQVIKSEGSSRALQELTVAKIEGEISFIEVPMEDSVSLPRLSQHSSDNSTLSTQPFSPTVSNDISGSSSNHSPKPALPSQSDSSFKQSPKPTPPPNSGTPLKQSPKPAPPPNSDSALKQSPRPTPPPISASPVKQSPKPTSLPNSDSPLKQSPKPSTPPKSASPVKQSPKPAPPQADSDLVVDDPSSTNQGTPTSFKSLRRRAYSIAPAAFKTPGATKTAKKERRRRKTDHLLKSPEEMVEILTKSPMVEMSRRKTRLLLPSDNVDKETASSTTEVDPPEAVQQQGAELPTESAVNQEKMDRINHYKQLVITESQRLTELCDKWTDYLKEHSDIPEEAQGQLLSTVGKTQLLMDQKFKQFSGLINDCEFNLGENVVNPTDLQGFWDMIYYQVEDVDKLFVKLSDLEQANWQVKQPSPQKALKKKVILKTSKPKVKSNFAAFRQVMMTRKATEPAALNTSIDMATVDSDKNKVFDAGFFKVSSPIRSYSGLGSKKATPVIPLETDDGSSTPEKKTPVIPPVTDDSTSTPQKKQDSICDSESPLNDAPATPSLSNKENNLMATPMNRLLSAKRKSYAPTVPSPLLNDITGLRTKK